MLQFFVHGTPKPGGSKRAFYNKKLGRALIVDACEGNKPWREAVKWAAIEAAHSLSEPINGPVYLNVTFHMLRPKSHYKKSGGLREDAPFYHTIAPDATKLLRSTEDALTDTHCIWRDDARVSVQHVTKIYASQASGVGATVIIQALEDAKERKS